MKAFAIFPITFLFFLPVLLYSQEYDAELVVQKTNIVVNKGKMTTDQYFEIRINKRAGEKYTHITIPYSRLYKLTDLKAFIKDANGKIVKKLKKSDVTDRNAFSDISFYEDDFVKEFTLKHNSYPYYIVYSYQIQQNEFFFIDDWIPVIDNKVPTIAAELSVTVPIGYQITYTNRFVEDPITNTLENMVRYHWKTSYTDIVYPEIYSPPLSELLPSVFVVPKKFRYEKEGAFKDWRSLGNWQFELLQNLNELPENEKSKILTLLEGIQEDKKKIRTLYHYLQDETRYISISIETGGLKPYPASYVARHKYGDCKALTNYFKALLDFAGIGSYYSLVYAGNPIKKINKDFPSQQFNHVILYVPLKDEDLWLDCTSDEAFGYLGTFTQNRDAFIVEKNHSHFKRTPTLTPSDVMETRTMEIRYDLRKAYVCCHNTYKGSMYESLLQLQHDYSESERSRILNKFFGNNGLELLHYQFHEYDRDSATIGLSYEATTQRLYKRYGNDILIRNIPFSLSRFPKPKDRKLPVQINYPICKTDTIIYHIPEGYITNKNFVHHSVSNAFGQYKYDIYEKEGKIFVIKSLLINAGYYPVSDYTDFYGFYNDIVDTENKTHLSITPK